MEKEREVERRVDPPARRDDVRVAGNRCPYCHEDVARESADVCRDCLARHHGACWTEGTRCGSCGSEQVLRPVLPPLTPERARRLAEEAFLRAGYSGEEARGALAPTDRCPTPGCLERGVARGNASAHLHCPAHAASMRGMLLGAGLLFMIFGLFLALAIGLFGAVQREPPVLIAGLAIGLVTCSAGGLLIRLVRTLPPLPAPAPPAKGA